jgi:RNA polymerase sigma factor (TIGR02999 family)
MSDARDLTQLIAASAAGDAQAGERLWQEVYGDLHRLARARASRLAPGATLDTTALVHESFLRLAGAGLRNYSNRKHFFATAASAMRQIVIDQARRHASLARTPVPEAGDHLTPPTPWPDEVLSVASAVWT